LKTNNLRWPLRITQERRDGTLVLVLAGRFGFASATSLTTAVAGALARGDRHLVLDLASVDYVSSAGLNALEAAADRCAETRGSLVLSAVSEPVRLALELGGLLKLVSDNMGQ
jgi:anti-anti-sigma factor